MKSTLTSKEIKHLSKRSLFRWIFASIVDWAIILLALYGYHIADSIFLLLLTVLLIGNRQHALTVLGHDASHRTMSNNKKINDILSDILAFFPLGLTTDGYRAIHKEHHRHTNTEKDPELLHRGSRAPQWDLPLSLPRVFLYCIQDLMGWAINDYYIIFRFSKLGRVKDYFFIGSFHCCFLVVAYSSGLMNLAMIWYLSLVTSFMMFFRIRTFLEHLGTTETHRVEVPTLLQHIIAPHNISYHWEHHTYPTIPFYNLPIVRNKLNKAPIKSLKELINFYIKSPSIKSGSVLIK